MNMKPSLIDLVFRSEKRKNILLLLDGEPKNIEEIKDKLDVSSTSILPPIKKLIDNDLLVQEDRMYRLSDLGEFVVKKVKPLISAIGVLEQHNDYWICHDLSSIPRHLLERISEVGNCTLIEPDLNHVYEPSPKIIENMTNSKKVFTFASYFNPAYLCLYVELGKKDAELSLNLTQSVWNHLSNEHPKMVEEILSMENISLFISREMNKISEITVTDKIMLLGLFDNNGKFDQQFLISFEPGALNWGKELYDYFKSLAKQMTNI